MTTKVYFTDFWKGFEINNNFLIKKLKEVELNLIVDKAPSYLFFSSFGDKHLKYKNCIKIYYTGENNVPDFNLCDYAMGFHHIKFEDRYLRLPLYLIYADYYEQIKKEKKIDEEKLLNRKFCNFIYSNSKNSDPFRELFFKKLSEYKKVDSGGRLLNNIGGKVENKLEFIKQYKFTIAFENSSVSGYTTEKILEPMVVNSIPIYWGNPTVSVDFNEESFININNFQNINEAIEYIKYLDNNDDAYLSLFKKPWIESSFQLYNWDEKLSRFLSHIFNQKKEEAKRITNYGFVKLYKKKLSRKFL